MERALLTILAVLALAMPCAFARERINDFNGIRGLAMGGTYILNTNDETALAANPAALGKLRDFYGTVLDPEVDISSNYSSLNSTSSISNQEKIQDVVSSVAKSPGTYYHVREQLMPSMVTHNFGIGLIASQTTNAIYTNASQADVFHRDDMGLLLGYNVRLWGGRIKIGVTGKLISRIELNEPNFNPSQALDDPSLAAAGFLKEGVGVGVDSGLILTAPWDYLPSIGIVVHDIGGTSFNQAHDIRLTGSTLRPDTQVQDADGAISISPIHSNELRSTWTLEYKSLLQGSSEPDKAKLLHFGTEFNWSDIFFMRLGYNERYWTAGFELASEHYQFQITSYGEEVGTSTTPVEDRRYVMKVSWRF